MTIHSRRFRGLSLLAVALIAAVVALPAGAAERDEPLALDLSDADISVTLAPGAVRQVRAFREVAGERVDVELEARAEPGPGRPVLQRPPEVAQRLSVSVVLDPAAPLSIAGERLEISLIDRRESPAAPPAPAGNGRQAGEQPAIELTVGDSSVQIEGARDLLLEAIGSDVRTVRTSGLLVATLTGGSLSVADHRGNLVLTSDGTRQQVEELSGSYQLKLENGDLTARRWSAKGDATLTGVTLDLEAFDGALQLHGVASTFAIRQVAGGRIQLQGKDLLATLEGIEAPLAALFEGGSLRVDGYRGEARVAGNGTAFDLAGCAGQWTLTLQNGSDAVVRDFAGLLRAEVVDSTLDAEGVEALALKATGGRIGARRLGQLNRVEATDVELELDLTGVSALGAMTLAGATRSRITLSTPCVVRTVGGQGLPGEAAEVTGCDLEVPDRAPTRLHARRRYGGQATVLNVEVGEGVELSVEGR
jgi:hypothetical protein